MKVLIASDIHGSYYWTKKLIKVYDENKCDKMFLLGDILYHGPRNPLPKESDTMAVTKLLNSYSEVITCVKGNCDAAVDDMVLDFDVTKDYIIEKIDNQNWFLTHGHIYDDLSLPPDIEKYDIFLFGHIHVPVDKKLNNLRILNPGSVSIPKQNSVNSCLLYENGTFSLIDLTKID